MLKALGLVPLHSESAAMASHANADAGGSSSQGGEPKVKDIAGHSRAAISAEGPTDLKTSILSILQTDALFRVHETVQLLAKVKCLLHLCTILWRWHGGSRECVRNAHRAVLCVYATKVKFQIFDFGGKIGA